MTAECSVFRSLIPRDLMGDLSAEEQQSLARHLVDCVPCCTEHAQYSETLRQMRSTGDAEVPRHFFVYAEERSRNPWFIFRGMSFAWQGTIAAAVILLGIFGVSTAFRVNMRAENGAWIISFGRPAPPLITPAPLPIVDTSAIEARILKAMEDKNRREKLEWVHTLRAEMEKSNRSMTERQRRILQAALSEVEMRLGGQITATARTLEDQSHQALTDLYQVISTEREGDLASLNNRLNRFAATDQVRSNQTDAILDTLLQVAELKLK